MRKPRKKKELINIDLGKHIKDIPKEELKSKIGCLKLKSDLMRVIIMNERDYGTCTYNRTLRSLWYSTVKPALDKLDKLVDDKEETVDGWDTLLSKYMAQLVRAGELSYKDLHIEDESRSRNVVSSFDFSPCRNIIVAVEKDTTYNIVRDISYLLGVSCISAKGLNSLGAMESFIRAIRDNTDGEVKDIYFLILSDYDPAGLVISNTLKEQAMDVLKVLKMDNTVVHAERLGILPSQLTEDEIYNNWYSPKGDMDKWIAETGGIYGQPKGLELDAFTPDRIRKIFATSLKDYIHTENYVEQCKYDYLYERVNQAIRPYVDGIVGEIVREKIEDVNIDDFEILDYVKGGYSYIPTSQICSLQNDNLTEITRKYFA